MASNVVEELGDEFLNCAVCRCTYTEPKMLPCIHSFCRNCLELCKMASQQKGERFGCPICRTYVTLPPGGIKALPTNFLLQSLHDKLGEIKTKGTTSVPLHQAKRKLTRKVSKTRCPTHTNGLSMYCRTCKAFQCMSCMTSNEHKGHDLVDATEAELDVHETLELQAVLLESVQEHARCSETEERARRALHRVKREAASCEDGINQRAAEAVERIEAEKTAMLSRLHMIEARKMRLINRVLDSAAKTKSRCKEIESSIKESIKSEHDEDVAKTGAFLSQLEELRTELENIDLEDSLQSLRLEFEPSEVSRLVGELRDHLSQGDQNTTAVHIQSTAQEIPGQSQVNGEGTIPHGELTTEVTQGPQDNNQQSPVLTLAESLDAILNETLQPTIIPSTVTGECQCNSDHAWHPPPPPPPWHHPRHHHPPHHHRPPHHHHHLGHPFGPRWHRGMRHRHSFGGRGRCHHPM